ncbi:MAG TPA: ATP-binding protein [Longimicrobiaceae bacterium]|jgi:PAS domain S-box-containing protein|nr:ATP-binding protein [Longimicrobiaceae bacterium]
MVPDPNRTGAPDGVPGDRPGEPGRETAEREAALRRGESRLGARDPYAGMAPPDVAARAFAALAENSRDYAIFLMDPDGIITFWGEGARLIKWWTKEQTEGAHLRLLYPDGGSEDGTAESHLEEAAATGEYTGEGHRVRSDGSTFWAGVTLTALRDDAGVLLGFAKTTRDLTATRAAGAALLAANDAAEQARTEAEVANRAKSLFLATMSHEIRTPINAIMGYAELLDMELGGPLTEAQRGHLTRIRTSSVHLLGLIDEVLDFSRIEADRLAVGLSAGRIGDAVDGALALVQPQAHARGLDLNDRVSAFSADVTYWGDEERVRQVLVNLLSNAVKFTPPGGRITLSAGTAERPSPQAKLEGPGPWAYVRVEDTGPGIDPARLDAIFQPFEQVDMNLTRRHGGTGLGLTISLRLARLMGGDLTVNSEPGVGSTFVLWLPAAPLPAESLSPGTSPPHGALPIALLQAVQEAITLEMDRLLHAYVARLRGDPRFVHARGIPEPELEDHLVSFLADVAGTLGGADLAAGAEAGSLRDGTAIQRTIAQRHGAQRQRLGWTAAEVRGEFRVLREELEAALRRRLHPEREGEVDEAVGLVTVFVDTAEQVSLASHALAAAGVEDV